MKAPGVESRRRGIVAAIGLVLAVAGGARADEGRWRIELLPVRVEVGGHDQHVLTERGPGGASAVELTTDSALGYGAAVRLDREGWDWGLDFFIHRTDQGQGPLARSAAGPGQPVTFELPHRSFVSNGPDEVLYFQTLEDTTVELWVLDLYARRGLGAAGPWTVLLGVRNADFDNDYRAIAGLGDVGGTRLDASSNYSRMIGPMAGLGFAVERGRHTIEGDLRLAVVFGDIELKRTLRDFEGPPGPFAVGPEEVPEVPVAEPIQATDSIEVPMTGLRLAWRVRLGERWSLGARADATAWSDLAVPPGVVPDRSDQREETTLVTWGLGASVGVSF